MEKEKLEFEREKINLLINALLHSLTDIENNKEKFYYMPTENIFKSIDCLEKLYNIRFLLND